MSGRPDLAVERVDGLVARHPWGGDSKLGLDDVCTVAAPGRGGVRRRPEPQKRAKVAAAPQLFDERRCPNRTVTSPVAVLKRRKCWTRPRHASMASADTATPSGAATAARAPTCACTVKDASATTTGNSQWSPQATHHASDATANNGITIT